MKVNSHVSNFYTKYNTIKYYASLFRKPAEGTAESKPQQPDDSHSISVHVKKARGGRTLYGRKKSEEKLVEFMAILKKL